MQIHELVDEMTSIADAGNYFAVDNGVITQKIDYLRLAKAIIEVYNGSQINGANQTLQTAIAGLQEQIDDSLIVSSTYADFYTKCTALPTMKPVTFHCEGAVTSVITGGDVTLGIKGIIEKSDADTNRFDFFGYDGQGYMYAYRVKFVSSSEVVVQARKSTKDIEADVNALNTKKLILYYDLAFSSVAVPATGSANVSYSFPDKSGYLRAFMFIMNVSGSGTGSAIFTIHGSPVSGAVYIASGSGSAVTANFTLRCFYLANGHYSNITP